MSCKKEWIEDSEALGIAMDVVEKYEEMFNGIDLTRMRFLRILGEPKGKTCKVTSVGFPVNIDVPYLYYVEINDAKWKAMTEAQRNLTVFAGLFEIAPGGMDPESVNYGRKRKRDLEDYSEVVAAAGGRYDWKTTGATGIHDILLSKKDRDDIGQLMKDADDQVSGDGI